MFRRKKLLAVILALLVLAILAFLLLRPKPITEKASKELAQQFLVHMAEGKNKDAYALLNTNMPNPSEEMFTKGFAVPMAKTYNLKNCDLQLGTDKNAEEKSVYATCSSKKAKNSLKLKIITQKVDGKDLINKYLIR